MLIPASSMRNSLLPIINRHPDTMKSIVASGLYPFRIAKNYSYLSILCLGASRARSGGHTPFQQNWAHSLSKIHDSTHVSSLRDYCTFPSPGHACQSDNDKHAYSSVVSPSKLLMPQCIQRVKTIQCLFPGYVFIF